MFSRGTHHLRFIYSTLAPGKTWDILCSRALSMCMSLYWLVIIYQVLLSMGNMSTGNKIVQYRSNGSWQSWLDRHENRVSRFELSIETWFIWKSTWSSILDTCGNRWIETFMSTFLKYITRGGNQWLQLDLVKQIDKISLLPLILVWFSNLDLLILMSKLCQWGPCWRKQIMRKLLLK